MLPVTLVVTCMSSSGLAQNAESAATAQTRDRLPVPLEHTASQAVPSGANLLDQYRARELHTRFSFWTGQEVFRADKPVDVGYFGGNYREVFAGSAAALEAMSTYRTLRLTGTTAYVVGLSLLVADIVLLAGDSSSVVGRDAAGRVSSIKPLYWGLLIPGAVLGFSGAIAVQGANGYLSDAIDQYNGDLAQQLKADLAKSNSSRSIGLSLCGTF